ncbi:MAG: type II toxin-antitoxin system VapC family toxin [Leptolyngbya sp. SIO1E4]|nr:type II toxin-antitoxin system VapC family toxin [Leptolyngbya sp. SIO1E4]
MVLAALPRFTLDTNVALYLLGNRLAEPLPRGHYSASVITEMELLSYPDLSVNEEQQIQNFIGQLQIINLSNGIKKAAIDLRKQHGLKLPDAIIAATALTLETSLLTNDNRLLNLTNLKTYSVKLV